MAGKQEAGELERTQAELARIKDQLMREHQMASIGRLLA